MDIVCSNKEHVAWVEALVHTVKIHKHEIRYAINHYLK